MTALNLIAVHRNGAASPAEIEALFNTMLERQLPRPGIMRLEGADALDIDSQVRDGAVHLRYLSARSADGLHVEIADRYLAIPWPMQAEQSLPILIALDWRLASISDGSSLAQAQPTPVLIRTAQDAGRSGFLAAGAVNGRGEFDSVPVPADRFDACAALVTWRDRLLEMLTACEERLAAIGLRCARTPASAIAWTHLATPVLVALAEARAALCDDADPCRADAPLERFFDGLANLSRRAGVLGRAALAAWLRALENAGSARRSTDFAARCAHLCHRGEAVLAGLDVLARSAGLGLTSARRLSELLFRDERLYRRWPGDIQGNPIGDDRGRWDIEIGEIPSPAALAILWENADRVPLVLGDVRLVDATGEVLSLLGPLDGVEYHFVPDRPLPARFRLEAPPDLLLLDLAVYADRRP